MNKPEECHPSHGIGRIHLPMSHLIAYRLIVREWFDVWPAIPKH